MSECKCKPIINIQPKCEPTLDIRPVCPVVLDVATTQRGAPGKDATVNGVNTLEIVTTDGITSSMDGDTFTISGKTLETAIADEETRAKAAENIVAGAVLDEETRAKGAEQDLASSIESNHTAISDHVADKNNPHVVTKSQVGLGNCDNTSDADKPVSTATQTALNGKVDKTTTASKVYGTDASGNQTTYDADSFGKVDDVKVNGVSVVTNKVANLGTMASETASDYYTSSQVDTALAGKQGTLTASTGIDITSDTISVTDPTIVNNGTGTKALAIGKTSQSTAEGGVAVGYGAQANSTYATAVGYDTRANNTNTTVIGKGAKATQARAIAIGSGAEANAQDAIAIKGINSTANTLQVYTYTMLDMSTGLIPDARISTNIARTSAIPTVDQTYDGTSSNPQSGTAVASAIATETTNRENADISLQNQIDAIVSSSDVFDIVGTYADLQAYDISTVPVNDIIKVLVDSTHDNAATYYRCVESGGVKSWSYIGSEGAYYTKGEADNKFVPQTRTVNSKALSSDITLTATDVGALPDNTVIPTVNDATVTIQKNGSTVSTFTLNQSSNETVNITVPTDTDDLTNGAGFITGITSGDVTTALGYTPYNSTNPSGYITGITSGDVTTALGYTPYNSSNPAGYITGITSGDITTALGYTPYDSSNPTGYITGITSGDVTTALGYIPYNSSNPAGYITGITSGDVTTALGYTPVNPTSLASVATSGLYSDLSGKPNYGAGLSYSSSSLQLLDQNGNNLGSAVTIKSTPDLDGVTIDTNSDDELEAIGVIDNNGNAIKTWTGTLAQYNAIVTKDSNTLYNITDDVSITQTILEALYPIGSLYIGKMSTCPLASLIPNSTWTLVASDKVLQGSGTYTAGTSVSAGLPNITGSTDVRRAGVGGTTVLSATGCISISNGGGTETEYSSALTSNTPTWSKMSFNASASNSIYGNSTTVQPPAYVVNIWERTA